MKNRKRNDNFLRYIDKKIDERLNKTLYGIVQKKIQRLNPESFLQHHVSKSNRHTISEISKITKKGLAESAIPQIFGKTDSQIFNSFIAELFKY